MRTATLILSCLGSAALAPLGAQTVDLQLRPGTRVRVSAPAHGLQQSVMSYVGTRNDSLFLSAARVEIRRGQAVADTVVMTVPAGAVTRFELSLERRSNFLRWAGRGALIGGVAFGVAMAASSSENDFVCDGAGCVVVGVVGGAFYGGLLGGLLGALTRHDVWVDVSVPHEAPPLAPLVLPLAGGGVALGMVLRL